MLISAFFKPTQSAVLFFATLLVAAVLQGILWTQHEVIDMFMWADQGEWLMSGNPNVFGFDKAYAHPGGTVVEGVLLLGKIGLTGDVAVTAVIIIFNSVVITLCVWLCHKLRRDWWWASAVLLLLSSHPLYLTATPTTAIAAPLVVLLCLFTIALFEKKLQPSAYVLAGWGVVSGLVVATRADIGVFSSAFFGALLLTVLPWTRILFSVVVAGAIFVIANPFMWFMPIQHIFDLIHKITWHYADFTPTHMSLMSVVQITLTSWISMGIAAMLWWKKIYVIPAPALGVLYTMTIVLYTVFLTSDYQAVRYFMPVVFIWDILLPLFFLSALQSGSTRFKVSHWSRAGVLCLVVLPHLIALIWALSRPWYFV